MIKKYILAILLLAFSAPALAGGPPAIPPSDNPVIDTLTVGEDGTTAGDVTMMHGGTWTMYDADNDTSVVIGPVTDGTTTLPITGSIDVSGTVSGATYGSDGSITDAELLGIDDGATTEIPVGGGAGSSMVWTTATGTGAPVRANSPVLIAPSLGDATATSITIDPSAIPAIELTDSDTTDEDTGIRFYGNATATGTGVEVYDWAIAAQGAATAGTMGDVITWTGATKILSVSGTLQSKVIFHSYSADQTLTYAVDGGGIAQFTVAGEATMWDATAATVGQFVTLWARDAEKIEVVPASGDHFVLFNGTALTADYELDCSAVAGNKVTLLCTAENTWSVFSETGASTDGGVAD